MEFRRFTGYVAHAALAAYWLWVVSSTAPQLRKGMRDRRLRMQIALLKTAGIAVTALLVGIIHFWATAWWQIVVAIPVVAGCGWLLHRAFRRIVAAPRHRLTLVHRIHRVRRFERQLGPYRHRDG
jgi:small-conductance mechanosensitive channel